MLWTVALVQVSLNLPIDKYLPILIPRLVNTYPRGIPSAVQDILKEKMEKHMILQGFEIFLPEFFFNKDDTYAQLCGYISGGDTTRKVEKVCEASLHLPTRQFSALSFVCTEVDIAN